MYSGTCGYFTLIQKLLQRRCIVKIFSTVQPKQMIKVVLQDIFTGGSKLKKAIGHFAQVNQDIHNLVNSFSDTVLLIIAFINHVMKCLES